MAHQRQRLGDDDFRPGDGERQGDAQHRGKMPGLRSSSDDEMIATESAGTGGNAGRAAARGGNARDRRVLQDAPAMILQRPGIGLRAALWVGVTAPMHEIATNRVVADQRDERLELGTIQRIRREALARRIGDRASMVQELPLGKRHPHAAALIFGGIAEQLVHLRPQALLLDEERAEMVAGAAAVSS